MVRLVAEGKPKSEVARITGKSPSAVDTAIKKYPTELEVYQEKYRQKLLEEVMPSVERIVSLRDTSKNDNVRLGAAKDLIDRAEGHLGNLGQKKYTIVFNVGGGSSNQKPPDREVIDIDPSS